MKQYTNKTQTAKLLGMGYPPPQRCPLTSNTPAYSIGELLSFIEQNGLCYSLNRGSTSGRYVFMKYYPFAEIEGEELIEVLYKDYRFDQPNTGIAFCVAVEGLAF